ncbi:MAG: hypothetical protein KAW52_00500 [candidate division Zixibacteria bacterium]|nr:hypothetical protein [candidate division Zixibacteria bacterium]
MVRKKVQGKVKEGKGEEEEILSALPVHPEALVMEKARVVVRGRTGGNNG